MSADATGLQLPISFTLDEARSALRELEQAARVAGRGVQEELGGRGAKGVQSLTDRFKEFKKEQVQQGRLVGFYVRELAEFTGASRETKDVLGVLGNTLAEAATSGLGFGLAIEAVKGAMTVYQALTKENQRETSELTKLLQKQREELEKIRFLQGGGTERRFEVDQQRKAAQEQLDALKKKIASDEAFLAGGGVVNGWKQGEDWINRIRSDLGKQYEERSRLIQELGAAESNAIAADNAEAANRLLEDEKQRQAEVRRQQEDHHKQLLEEQRKYQAAFKKAQAEFSLGAWQTTRGVDLTGSQGGVLALQAERASGVRRLSPSDYALGLQQYSGSLTGGAGAGLGPTAGITAAEVAKMDDKLAKEQEKEKERLKQLQGEWEKYGEAAGSAVGSVITKQKTLGEAAREVGALVLQTVLRNAIAQITATAPVAGANAAASQAGIPIVGPALAAGAMAAVMGMVMALVGQVGSAETGAALPSSGGPFPFLLHPNEWVLPAPITRGLQGVIEGGGDGGGRAMQIHFNGPVYDRQGVYRLLADNRQQVQDWFDDERRLGRSY